MKVCGGLVRGKVTRGEEEERDPIRALDELKIQGKEKRLCLASNSPSKIPLGHDLQTQLSPPPWSLESYQCY